VGDEILAHETSFRLKRLLEGSIELQTALALVRLHFHTLQQTNHARNILSHFGPCRRERLSQLRLRAPPTASPCLAKFASTRTPTMRR
jgi:hypothetical protein